MDRKKILVADHEIYILHILEFSLGMEGYNVLTATDGEEALRLVGQEHPDLVLLECVMPRMDGFEACRRLRQNESTRTLPVVLILSPSRAYDRETAEAAGANAFVTKPFSPRKLLEKIRELLDEQVKKEP